VGLDPKRAALVACVLAAGLACKRTRDDERAPVKPGLWAIPRPPPPAATPAPRGNQITLVYTSNDDGDYEQCGCPVHPLGGIARRATVIDRARAEADATLVLDAGDVFIPPGINLVGYHFSCIRKRPLRRAPGSR